eukprot:CAMPEP_0113846014 /NCGR_PEP_ID=MMETSP0372-20130328/1071_1 /TAXON_ID=340204 /ORGANISM="Lankesteria abbotti" /LENGTH=168 /DNA_ID=CAMNT_0000815109 /DNA_START=586 /DNA_END=1092 /DNA_ORIENTATION=+ /assembly_acc=CAM_ASM_000359
MYTVGVKVALKHVDNDENRLLFYNLGISSILFFPLIFIGGEAESFSNLPFDTSSPDTIRVWVSLLVSGVMGYSLAFASYFCIRVTSPVTYNITGYAKACLQSLGGIVFLGEVFTAQSLSSIFLTLAGSMWYSQIKMSEMQPKRTTELPSNKGDVEVTNLKDGNTEEVK